MSKEKLFYETLKNVFIGEKIEGTGGYVNLMRIKSRYYERIEKLIKHDVEELTRKYPSFREELYDKLYSFFRNYFSESGSIFLNPVAVHNQVYEKVYTDEDVSLFWKTQSLYYIKTDRIFKSMKVELDGKSVFFDASEVKHKKNNEKRSLFYEFDKVENGTLYLKVRYKEGNRETDFKSILRQAREGGLNLQEEDLKRAIRTFERQSEVDYFINKNARKFLKEQFNLWLYRYLTDVDNEWTPERIEQIQGLKRIAYKLIDFVGQFEEELAKIWEKPRFVRKSNYVISLDRIASKGGWHIVEKLPNLPGWKDQVGEWIELRILEKEPASLLEGEKIKEEYRFLPLDTKHFKEVELEILGLFNNLDQELDGWLIKSENWQALNTILPRFKGKVKTIYIDPPYNTGEDEFIYEDSFRRAAWLTMLENRLKLAREFLSEDGIIFVSIGDTIRNEDKTISSSLLNVLMSGIFGLENYVATIVRKTGIAPRHDAKHVANAHDYILCYAKNARKLVLTERSIEELDGAQNRYRYKDEFFEERGFFALNKLDRGSKKYSESLDYAIVVEKGRTIEVFDGKSFYKVKTPETIEVWPGGSKEDKRWIWTWSYQKVQWGIENSFVVFRKTHKGWQVYIKEYQFVDRDLRPIQRSIPYHSIIEDCFNEKGSAELYNLFGRRVFDYAKPEGLINRLLSMVNLSDGDVVMDFFAGSGTTARAVLSLRNSKQRKIRFLLIELDEHFYKVLLPSIKKVAFCNYWKEGKPQTDGEGTSLFFVYCELEQYEDVLQKVRYNKEEPYAHDPDRVFMGDEKLLHMMDDEGNLRLKELYPDVDLHLTAYFTDDTGLCYNCSVDETKMYRLVWWE